MVFRVNRGCPVCGSELSVRRTPRHQYEQCRACHGLWISIPVLYSMANAMKEGTLAPMVPSVVGPERTCPDCQAPMTRVTLYSIPVDYCGERQHGVWFDKDELQLTLERVADGDLPPPAPPTSFTSLLEDFFSR